MSTKEVRELTLSQLYARKGTLTGEILVDAARSPTHVMHDDFEWDDSIAGEKYRVEQARSIIRSVKIEILTGHEEIVEVRAYQHFTPPELTGEEDAEGEGSYIPHAEVTASPHMREVVLRRMERAIMELERQYGIHDEFWAAISRMEKRHKR